MRTSAIHGTKRRPRPDRQNQTAVQGAEEARCLGSTVRGYGRGRAHLRIGRHRVAGVCGAAVGSRSEAQRHRRERGPSAALALPYSRYASASSRARPLWQGRARRGSAGQITAPRKPRQPRAQEGSRRAGPPMARARLNRCWAVFARRGPRPHGLGRARLAPLQPAWPAPQARPSVDRCLLGPGPRETPPRCDGLAGAQAGGACGAPGGARTS